MLLKFAGGAAGFVSAGAGVAAADVAAAADAVEAAEAVDAVSCAVFEDVVSPLLQPATKRSNNKERRPMVDFWFKTSGRLRAGQWTHNRFSCLFSRLGVMAPRPRARTRPRTGLKPG